MLSDVFLINIVDEDYVESWFSNEKASQTIAVRSKTDKCPSTNKTMALDVHAKRYQLENAVRVKQESEARTQSPKIDKKNMQAKCYLCTNSEKRSSVRLSDCVKQSVKLELSPQSESLTLAGRLPTPKGISGLADFSCLR